jgi:hypothetical protein
LSNRERGGVVGYISPTWVSIKVNSPPSTTSRSTQNLSIRLSRNPSYYYFILKPVPQYNSTMKFTSTTVAILSAMIAKTAFAGNFNYGVATYDDGHQDHAIWVNGENACNYEFLGPNSESPCSYNGGWFTLDEVTYELTGCGGSSFCILNADGSGNSCAEYEPENPIGGCSNDYGSYNVQQQFYFP